MYVIIVGVNNLSKSLVEWYSEHDNEITIIEKEFDKCHYFDQIFGPICQNGDATDIETQAIAGMNRADVLITATKSDKDNFLISMIAKSKFKVKKIINIVNDSNFSNAFSFFGKQESTFSASSKDFCGRKTVPPEPVIRALPKLDNFLYDS